MNVKIVIGCTLGLVAVLYQLDLLFTVFTIVAHLSVASLGIYLGVSWTLVTGKQYTPPPIARELEHPPASIVLQNMMEGRSPKMTGPSSVVTTRNMDLVIQDVLDLVLRDFIISWYKDLSDDQQPLLNQLLSDLWLAIGEIKGRLSSIDTVQLVTKDLVDILINHFKKIRNASKKNVSESPVTNFKLHPWLKSPETELAFLRKVSEVLLIIVLPKNYVRSSKVMLLLKEVVANTMLKPTIDLICDPDYINRKLLSYIEYREQISEATQKTYTYAASYEDFIKIIEKCGDLEQLKQLRFHIMTEIMHATTINNLKKPLDRAGSPKGTRSTAKGELLKQRNLKRYINQLKVAKSRSEKRISLLGGTDYKNYNPDSDESRLESSLSGHKVYPFSAIMESATGREYFKTFLQREDNESLIGFWNAVLKLKTVEKRQQHHVAADTYQRYISSSASRVKNFIDKPRVRRMETFMKGDSGPEAFFEAQQTIAKLLEEQHYPSFLVSDVYNNYVTLLNEGGEEAKTPSNKDELFFEPKEGWSDGEEEREGMFSTQSYNAKQRLQQLDQRIGNKRQALEAVRMSSKTDANYRKAEEDLEEEVRGLEAEKRNLEAHIERTTNWCENVGKWKAHIYESTMPEGEKVPVFVIVIHLSGSSNSQNLQNSTEGWVVTRKLQDFYAVHEKLVQIVGKTEGLQAKIAGNWLKNKELPRMPRFTGVDNKFLKESKEMLNDYLSTIMKDERLAQSEALYGFLTPTPDYFQQPAQEKKSTFLRNILKNFPLGSENKDADEELQFFAEDRSEDRSKDSIAEPMYSLIDEVYELHGMFKWFRKSFITFVEVTFGRSINRQLRETIQWIFSESMVIYYIRLLKDSLWPQGELAPPLPESSPMEKLERRLKAKEKFLSIQPDAVKSLVGEENARRGTIKMFEVLQDVRLNKHLFYMLLRLLLSHLDPELRDLLQSDTQDDTPLVLSGSGTDTQTGSGYIPVPVNIFK